ncbi:MFS transporter [Amycolatopsis suaedae]|uniref:MFS transporter n=1 Tax=Amycolatopsis suaedae TaxID=2510978 RepID=A0A4Q7JDN4_9PSEU|nr:MFS transporter [Amycolatopsis suaedae]RZQ66011.1 MFS transporter [Amycolatopsis suaedae]
MNPQVRAGRREWTGLAVLALPTLLLALDVSVLYLALPTLSTDLGASSTEQLWIVDIYGFMVAGFLVTMGSLGDRIGRRRLLLIGAAAFGVASAVAAFAVSAEMLILARAALGIAGATLGPSTLALISTIFRDDRQRAMAVGVWMSCFMGGNALGPIVGGALLEAFWWGSVFLLGVPVMVLLLLVGPAVLPEYRDTTANGPLDLPSVGLSLLAILPFIHGLKEIARHGPDAVPLLSVLAGLGFGVAFVRRQRRLDTPLLDLRLFANRSFSIVLALFVCGGVFLSGSTLLMTQFLQLVEGLTPLEAALWMLPAVAAMTASSLTGPMLTRWFRPGYVLGGGMVVAAAGFLVVTQVGHIGGLTLLVTGWTIACAGNGLPAALGAGIVVGSVPARQAGSASSVWESGTEFSLAMGVAALGSLSTVVYRDALPGDAPAEITDGLGAALAAADRFPHLVEPARQAYTEGLSLGALLCAVACTALGMAAAVLLRETTTKGEDNAEPAGQHHAGHR